MIDPGGGKVIDLSPPPDSTQLVEAQQLLVLAPERVYPARAETGHPRKTKIKRNSDIII